MKLYIAIGWFNNILENTNSKKPPNKINIDFPIDF